MEGRGAAGETEGGEGPEGKTELDASSARTSEGVRLRNLPSAVRRLLMHGKRKRKKNQSTVWSSTLRPVRERTFYTDDKRKQYIPATGA